MLMTAPRGVQSGNRATWFGLYYNISGFGVYLHPVGLELLVDHKALDPAQWTIQKVFFQGRYYESLAQLEEQFEAGQVNVVVIPDNGTGGSWSLIPGAPGSSSPSAVPSSGRPLQCPGQLRDLLIVDFLLWPQSFQRF